MVASPFGWRPFTVTDFTLAQYRRMAPRPRSFAGWTRYGAGALTLLAASALIVGTVYQYHQNRRDLQEHPAPGQLVDIGGHRLHLWCTGAGSPVVVLEVGGSGNVLEWNRVQPEVAKTTRVCSYDRAGFGWSELGPNPRSAVKIVSELHSLLQAAHGLPIRLGRPHRWPLRAALRHHALPTSPAWRWWTRP